MDLGKLQESWIDIRTNLNNQFFPNNRNLFAICTKRSERENLLPIGTGFIISLNNNKYFIIALHVIEKCDNNLGAYVVGEKQSINLPNNYEKYSDLDLVIFNITDNEIAQTNNGIDSLLLTQNSFEDDDHFFMVGFPSSNNKRLNGSNGLTPMGVSLQKTTLNEHNYEFVQAPDRILLNYNRTGFMDDKLQPIEEMIKPQGFSGSPIFHIGSLENIQSNNIHDVKCIGIFTGFKEKEDIAYGSILRFVE